MNNLLFISDLHCKLNKHFLFLNNSIFTSVTPFSVDIFPTTPPKYDVIVVAPVPLTIIIYNKLVKEKGLGFSFRYILLMFAGLCDMFDGKIARACKRNKEEIATNCCFATRVKRCIKSRLHFINVLKKIDGCLVEIEVAKQNVAQLKQFDEEKIFTGVDLQPNPEGVDEMELI